VSPGLFGPFSTLLIIVEPISQPQPKPLKPGPKAAIFVAWETERIFLRQ